MDAFCKFCKLAIDVSELAAMMRRYVKCPNCFEHVQIETGGPRRGRPLSFL